MQVLLKIIISTICLFSFGCFMGFGLFIGWINDDILMEYTLMSGLCFTALVLYVYLMIKAIKYVLKDLKI